MADDLATTKLARARAMIPANELVGDLTRKVQQLAESIKSNPDAAPQLSETDPRLQSILIDLDATNRQLNMHCYTVKNQGNRLFESGNWPEARAKYENAIRITWSEHWQDRWKLPSDAATLTPLMDVAPKPWLDSVACANNIAQCYLKEGNRLMALDWLQEIHYMYQTSGCIFGNKNEADYPWRKSHMEADDYFVYRVKVHYRISNIYSQLSNSAAAAEEMLDGLVLTGRTVHTIFNESVQCPRLVELRKQMKFDASKRHPNLPQTVKEIKFDVIEPTLQVRGLWKHFRFRSEKKTPNPPSRALHASVVRNGKYYVFGGRHGATGVYLRDAWVLDLRDIARGWRALPAPPESIELVGHSAAVYQCRVYIFTGTAAVSVFDLDDEKWSEVQTRLADTNLPWDELIPGRSLVHYTVHVIGHGLFVFGGRDKVNVLGRNTLLRLDFLTHNWTLLSGTVSPNPNRQLPGPRFGHFSWVTGETMYVGTGLASRSGAQAVNHPEGYKDDFWYDDLWSYSTTTGQWIQEKMRGNPPNRRTETAHCYNGKWNRGIVFGGKSGSLGFQETSAKQPAMLHLFADTFLFNPETKRWAIVLTKSFPPYRSMGDLFTDDETGRTFLFGGDADGSFAPINRSASNRSFADVWELAIENVSPTFHLKEAESTKFVETGPWKACWKCGKMGHWRQCLGSCSDSLSNQAAFCSETCQRSAWSQHSKLDGCANTKRS